MARCIASIFSNCPKSLLNNDFAKNHLINVARTIFTPASMGIDRHAYTRQKIKANFVNVENDFRKRMRECIENNDKIFFDDLRHMTYLVENDPDDLDLYLTMMKKFCGTESRAFSNSSFNGAVPMRTFYLLNTPDVALKAFKDPSLREFFNQIISIQLLLDMLYKAGRYQECRDTYDFVKKHNYYPQNALVLVYASCYKENTPESYEYAKTLDQELKTRGIVPLRRRVCFFAALALKQGDPERAHNLVSNFRDFNHILPRNLRVLACLDLENYSDLEHLFTTAFIDMPGKPKHIYFVDVLNKVEEKLKDNPDSGVYKLLQKIVENDLVEAKPLEDYLCGEIDTTLGRNSRIGDLKKQMQKSRLDQSKRLEKSIDMETLTAK